MASGAQLRYGIIKGEDTVAWIPIRMGASEVLKAKSGRFVKDDGSSRMEVAVDGSTLLSGWVESADQTTSATEGATECPFVPASGALGCVFRIPINSGTYVVAMQNNTCDLSVSSDIQGAQLDASAEDTLIVVDGDTVNNAWVDVMLNPDKIASLTGVV